MDFPLHDFGQSITGGLEAVCGKCGQSSSQLFLQDGRNRCFEPYTFGMVGGLVDELEKIEGPRMEESESSADQR